ncbi:MAG TPA: hypothetical protein VN881_04245 [Candidatus Acidoferrales bacterium]|nr:hypothetical protein [Candidatus Acidoferrales bacterium]
MRLILRLGFLGVIVAAAFYYLRLPNFSVTAGADAPQPLWEIDLTKYGYQGRPPILLGNVDAGSMSWTYKQGVVFTEPDVIAAFFVARDQPPNGSAEQSKASPSDSFRLETIFLNIHKGEYLKKLELPLPVDTHGFLFSPATKGNFIVGIGNALTLYSPDLKIIAQYTAQGRVEGIASPSGETVLLGDTQRVSGQWIEQFDLLETEGLSVLKSWKSAPQMNQILWGDEIASMTPQSISIKTPDTAAKPLVTGREWFCGDWSFINKETIAMCPGGAAKKLSVVSTDGKILHQFDLGSEQMDGPAVASQNGKRFAVPTMHWGSGGNKDPEKLIARVFGLDADKPILTLRVMPHYSSSPNFLTPEGDTRFGWGGLALSPEGELLAVKSGPIVQLYQLPEVGSSTKCIGDCSSDNDDASSRSALAHRQPDSPIKMAAPSQLVEQALSWLPADTETAIAANGPFSLPDLNPEERNPPVHGDADETGEIFEGIPVGLFGFKKGLLGKYFKNEKVLLALEGSRNFRTPAGLGESPYQGCDIAVFASDIKVSADAFLKNSSDAVLRTEQIDGQQVTVFQEKLEEDTWTTFVAFPKPNIAVAATNEGYLREVLARINGKRGERALPASLPEWRYVNTHAVFWALRHYKKKGASTDPTTPFAGQKSSLISDDQAIGLAFYFDPDKSKTSTITYLSGDKSILQNVQKHLFPIETEPGAREMHIRYREIMPGVVEGSYDLDHIESAEVFTFVLIALLGHVVYL